MTGQAREEEVQQVKYTRSHRRIGHDSLNTNTMMKQELNTHILPRRKE